MPLSPPELAWDSSDPPPLELGFVWPGADPELPVPDVPLGLVWPGADPDLPWPEETLGLVWPGADADLPEPCHPLTLGVDPASLAACSLED